MHKITLEYGMIDDKVVVKPPTLLGPATSVDAIAFQQLEDGRTQVTITIIAVIEGKVEITK